ncbi:flagellar hook-length control protein FliK [Arcobacter sp.]|uniref:flagellar hook-length control protein FliK n=1 Tax=Arcobacter sp. TaxID=1872629 RepID=UPI003D0A721C
MLISTNTQLNILVANNTNKVLKEVLKEADVKTLTSQNKDLNVSTLLKTLFNNIQDNSKSNETVLNLLKNSNLNKDLGSFTSNLQSLIKSLPDDKSTDELKTFLQKFSITPDQATAKNVEGQIQKSGIFLESKLLNQVSNPTNKNENSLLDDMKAVLLKTKAQLETLINNQNKNQTQSAKKLELPQNNTVQVNQTTNKENNPTINTLKQIDKLLTQIKTLETPTIKETLIKSDTTNEIKPTPQTSNTQNIKSDAPIFNEIKTLLTKVQSQFQSQISNQSNTQTLQKMEIPSPSNQPKIEAQTTSQLLQIKAELLKTEIPIQQQNQAVPKENINTAETLKQIDKILNQLKNLDSLNTKDAPIKTNLNFDSKGTMQTNTQIIRTDSNLFTDIKSILSKLQVQFQNQVNNQSQIQEEMKTITSKESDPSDTLKQVDKLLTQIDYHQLYSIANSSNNVYIPFLWDLLEDGSIDIKKIDEEKFYCLIDLTLKDLGKINLHLYLYEDDKLDVSIFVEKDDTKQLIRQKATALRQELNKTAISVIGLNIYTLKEDTKENIYKIDDNFDFGVNIKV